MRRLSLLLILIILLATFSPVYSRPWLAPNDPQRGAGGTIRIGYVAASLEDYFNPFECFDYACIAIAELLLPRLIGFDLVTGLVSANATNGLAQGWEFSEDGTELTIHLRRNLHWSDGTPITAEDVKSTYDQMAIMYTYPVEYIESVEVVDSGSVRFHFYEPPRCSILADLSTFILPAHVQVFDIDLTEFDRTTTITGGLFRIEEWETEKITLVPNPSPNGDAIILPEALEFYPFSDEITLVEAVQGDLIDVTLLISTLPAMQMAQAADLQTFEFPGLSYDYIGLNMADQLNPLDGVDADGNPVSQIPHPILGDAKVRRAIQLALNVPLIIDDAVQGFGSLMSADENAHRLDSDLAPIPYDPEQAVQLLEEAGWERGSDGVWVAQDSAYAPTGTPLRLNMITNEGNARREAVMEQVQAQLGDIGIEIDTALVEFNDLLDTVDAQNFDTYILGWRSGLPLYPDLTYLFSVEADVTFSGFNMVSYYNPEAEALMTAANYQNGCEIDREGVARLSEILQEDQPYIWLYAINNMYVSNGQVSGWHPYPFVPLFNVQGWSVNE